MQHWAQRFGTLGTTLLQMRRSKLAWTSSKKSRPRVCGRCFEACSRSSRWRARARTTCTHILTRTSHVHALAPDTLRRTHAPTRTPPIHPWPRTHAHYLHAHTHTSAHAHERARTRARTHTSAHARMRAGAGVHRVVHLPVHCLRLHRPRLDRTYLKPGMATSFTALRRGATCCAALCLGATRYTALHHHHVALQHSPRCNIVRCVTSRCDALQRGGLRSACYIAYPVQHSALRCIALATRRTAAQRSALRGIALATQCSTLRRGAPRCAAAARVRHGGGAEGAVRADPLCRVRLTLSLHRSIPSSNAIAVAI